jgi:hypothetical protein
MDHRRRAGLVVAVVAVAVVVTPDEPFSMHAHVVTWSTVTVIGLLAIRWGIHRPASPPAAVRGRPVSRSRRRGYVVWAALFLAFLVHQQSMFWSWPRDPYPTLSALWNWLLEPWPIRVAAYATWVLFGVFLVRRIPVDDHAEGPPSWRAREGDDVGEVR